MDLALNGKRAIVLGGTRGIGRAIVNTLVGEGARVAFCARNAGQVAEAETALDEVGGDVIGGAVDATDGEALKQWVGDVATAFGGIDILISNASALANGPKIDAWWAGLELDILGMVNAVDAAQPHLEKAAAENGDASIIAISSVSALETTNPNAYGAIKAALIHYTKGLAKSLAAKNVRANAVSPGTIYFKGGVWNFIEENMAAEYKAALARNPTGRMGTPQEVANAAVFLASPAASFITGSNLVVDGAITSRVDF